MYVLPFLVQDQETLSMVHILTIMLIIQIHIYQICVCIINDVCMHVVYYFKDFVTL